MCWPGDGKQVKFFDVVHSVLQRGDSILSVFINPLRMRSRVTVVCLSVCMSVCLSVNALTARVLISAIQNWYYQDRHDT